MNQFEQQQPSNQYDFITNPSQPTKQPLFGGGSTKSRIFVVVGGIVLLLILVFVASTLMSSGKKSLSSNLKTIVAQQEEITRVARLGADKSLSSDVRAFALSTEMSTRTSQQELIGLLQKNKIKLEDTELAAKKDPDTDKLLESALASNRYDETFRSTLNEQLAKYASNLKIVSGSVNSESASEILNRASENVSKLLSTNTQAQTTQ